MRRPTRAVLLLLVFFAPAVSPSVARGSPVRLDPVLDGVLVGGGVLMTGVGEFLLPRLPPPGGPLGAPDALQINSLDREAMAPRYSRAMDLASTITEYGAFALPVVVGLLADSGDALPLGAVYLESVTLGMSVKNLVDFFLPRYRPYVYTGGAEDVDPLEVDQSFPSGHTTLAFASATAGVLLFRAVSPRSPYLVPFAIASYSLAAATATLRVTSGMHFVTDVIAGAVIGSAFGYLMPAIRVR
jgi:membrane-associated phospholipid phosphatase